MEDTNTTAPIEVISHDCKIMATLVTTAVCSDVRVDITDDGRVRVYCGATTLFLGGWDAELLSRELLSAAVRAQHQLERAL